MKTCGKCGHVMGDDAVFCGSCGTAVDADANIDGKNSEAVGFGTAVDVATNTDSKKSETIGFGMAQDLTDDVSTIASGENVGQAIAENATSPNVEHMATVMESVGQTVASVANDCRVTAEPEDATKTINKNDVASATTAEKNDKQGVDINENKGSESEGKNANTPKDEEQLTKENGVATEVTKGEGKKKKGIVGTAKSAVAEHGKSAVTGFIVKRIVSYLLTIVLSVGTVFLTQCTMQEDFKDYYVEQMEPAFNELKEIAVYVDSISKNTSFDETKADYEENNIYERSKEMLKKVSSYSSDNKEINIIHNQLISACEDLVELSTWVYAASKTKQPVMTEYVAAVDSFKIKMEVFSEILKDFKEKYNL